MTTDTLSSVFAALADPTRRALLQRLADGEASVAELARPFEMSQPAISKHLKVLEQAGLVTRNRVGTARYSRLEAEPLREATEYMERYKRFWNTTFDRLDAALAVFQTTQPTELTTEPNKENPDD
jgi:DNA-binding transcriptional ArsR family regulator